MHLSDLFGSHEFPLKKFSSRAENPVSHLFTFLYFKPWSVFVLIESKSYQRNIMDFSILYLCVIDCCTLHVICSYLSVLDTPAVELPTVEPRQMSPRQLSLPIVELSTIELPTFEPPSIDYVRSNINLSSLYSTQKYCPPDTGTIKFSVLSCCLTLFWRAAGQDINYSIILPNTRLSCTEKYAMFL